MFRGQVGGSKLLSLHNALPKRARFSHGSNRRQPPRTILRFMPKTMGQCRNDTNQRTLMQGYDLDGTLAAVEYQQAGVRGLVNIFKSAKVIYKPAAPFVVITARPHATTQQRQATTEWLKENQPNFKAIYYVPTGSEATVAKSKAAIIKRLNLDSYTCDNAEFNRLLKPLVPGVTVYKMNQDGTKHPA